MDNKLCRFIAPTPNLVRHEVALFGPTCEHHRGMIAILCLSETAAGRTAIGCFDPRQPNIPQTVFLPKDAAESTFTETIERSIQHGSRLLYRGPRNLG